MFSIKNLSFAILFFTSISFADYPLTQSRLEGIIDVDLFTGPTMVSGQFSNQKNPNSYGFSLNVYFQSTRDVSFPSHMSIGNYNFSMVSNDSLYPLPVNQEVVFSTNFMNLLLNVYSTHNWGLYLGVGYSLVSLMNDTNEKNVQNYGAQQYELQARYRLSERWGFNYRTKWNQINQFQNGKFSFIEMWTHFVGVSYLIF